MDRFKNYALIAALCMPAIGIPRLVLAQQPTCDDIVFESSAVEEFPSVAQSCYAIVERNGRLYVRLVADVIRVNSDGTILLDLKGRDGSRIRQEYKPPPGFRASISGKPTPARDLRHGQEIRLYLPSDRWRVAAAGDHQ